MDDESLWSEPLDEEEEGDDEGPVLPRRPVADSADMDITPMIDITFLLLIFFIVCSTTSAQSILELPRARYGTGVSDRTSVVLTVTERGGPGPARVYLGDGKSGKPLPDDDELQAAAIAEAVEQGAQQGKTTVLIMADKGVKHGDVWAVESAAGRVEGVRLYVAVLEAE
jgi:biopolymer transport protein ExbD